MKECGKKRVSKPGPLALEAEVLLTAAPRHVHQMPKIVRQGLTALAAGAGFTLAYHHVSGRPPNIDCNTDSKGP